MLVKIDADIRVKFEFFFRYTGIFKVWAQKEFFKHEIAHIAYIL